MKGSAYVMLCSPLHIHTDVSIHMIINLNNYIPAAAASQMYKQHKYVNIGHIFIIYIYIYALYTPPPSLKPQLIESVSINVHRSMRDNVFVDGR